MSECQRARVLEALAGVVDPELGLSVVDLGLIYGIKIFAGTVRIVMTVTTPGCPVHEVMPEWIRRAVMGWPGVSSGDGVESVEVATTFDPPWTPDRIGHDLMRPARPA